MGFIEKFFVSVMATVVATSALLYADGVSADENLKIKKYPNGFTAAVYKNSEPPKRCSMRLLVKSGSLFETDGERGIAHYIEHMAFNGTKHFPSGDMTEYFQRLGMAFGSDTNAHTSFSETVYKLELPEVGDKVVDESLLLLRDYADSMTFEQKFIDGERSVILAEMNARDDANYRRAVREISLAFKGMGFADRMPIGTAGVIKGVNRPDFVKFYTENYRPDNMVLVVVGDVEPEAIFAKVDKIFGGFKAPAAPVRKMALGPLDSKKGGIGGEKLDIDFDSMSVPNLSNSSASLSIVREAKGSLDTVESRAESDRLNLLGYVLNARFQRIADNPDAKITGGGASYYDYCSKALVFSVSCDAPLGASDAATEELFRQVLSIDSISDTEVENAKKKIFDILQTAINGKSTRKNRALVSEIASAFSDGITFVSPEEDMRLTKAAYDGIGARELARLFWKTVAQSRVSLFVSDKSGVGRVKSAAALEPLYQKARATAYAADKFAVSNLVYSQFPQCSGVLERRENNKLNLTQIKFANGVAFNFKKTDYSKDEVLLNICIGGGIFDIPADRPEYCAAAPAIFFGGTKFQTASQINAAVNLMKMSLSAKISNGSLSINGSSNKKCAVDMVRYAATVVSDAAFREDAVSNLRNSAEAFYGVYQTEPSLRLKYLLNYFMTGNVAKLPGTFENFKRYSMADFAAWLKPILANSYLEISIVGDFDEEALVKAVSDTFGAMPPRKSVFEKNDRGVSLVPYGENVAQTYVATDEPRSLSCVFWDSSFGTDMHKMRVATILSAVLDDVLRKDVREGEGNVYSPFAFYSTAMWFDYLGITAAASFVEPSSNKQLTKTLIDCGKKLAADISQDEFQRAKTPIIKSLKTAERNNKYWLFSVMAKSQAYPVCIEMAENREASYKAVSLEDVSAMAREIFAKPVSTLSVMPEKSPQK